MRIYFYEKASTKSPIKRFIDKLPLKDQARFLEVIREIEENSLEAARVVFKPIEGKLWEIKFKSETAGYRVLYLLLEKDLMAWLHAFSKKARKRMKEVLK